MLLQGPPVTQEKYMCHRCGHEEDFFYQTVELFDSKKRIYLCSKNCYNRYHRVSQQFEQQHVTPRTGNTVRLTAHVSVNVETLPTLPDEPGAREDSQPGLGTFLADHKDGTAGIIVRPKKCCWGCCEKIKRWWNGR